MESRLSKSVHSPTPADNFFLEGENFCNSVSFMDLLET
jgi:hypothetical protein